MGEGGGEAFVPHGETHVGKRFAQSSEGRSDVAHGVGRLAAHGGRQSHHNLVDRLAAHIVLEIILEFGGVDRSQSCGHDAQRVGHREPAATLTVIYGQNPSHNFRLQSY